MRWGRELGFLVWRICGIVKFKIVKLDKKGCFGGRRKLLEKG